jgi:hypothetical protein
MKLTSRTVAAGAAALLLIGTAGPAAAASSTVRPDAGMSDCWASGSAPFASGGTVSVEVDLSCDTIVDSLQVSVTLTESVGGKVVTVASNWCSDSSTSGFSCIASTAPCQHGSLYGQTVDAVETNAVGDTTEDGWNDNPQWVAC